MTVCSVGRSVEVSELVTLIHDRVSNYKSKLLSWATVETEGGCNNKDCASTGDAVEMDLSQRGKLHVTEAEQEQTTQYKEYCNSTETIVKQKY